MSASLPGTPDALSELLSVAQRLRSLTDTPWSSHPRDRVKQAVVVLEQINRSAAAIRSDVLAEIERAGSWADDGERTFHTWMSARTGASRNTAYKAVGLSKSLSEDLPGTRKALADGAISKDHAEVIARECTRSQALRNRLSDPERGEQFLVNQARENDATTFAKIAKGWAIETDPKGADRQWRKDLKKEELTVVQSEDGCRVNGWLTPANGALLVEALSSHMGRKSADDPRTYPERQAAGLVSMAHQSLDSGLQLPGARIRPHLTITMDYHTLQRLVEATGTSVPAAFGGSEHADPAQWAQNWRPGDDHVISTSLNYDILQGVAPATLSDGTPLAPTTLSRLACQSLLSRVIFGPESTVLDSGREERIFTAGQTRAIIARDRHCQYPGCKEGPNRSEVHHSLEWFKHQGTTHVDLGILLCFHHHTVVHQREITISRTRGKWIFTNRHGARMYPPGKRPLEQPSDPPSLSGSAPLSSSPPLSSSLPLSTGAASPPPAPAPLLRGEGKRWPRRGRPEPGGGKESWTQQELLASPDPPF